MIEKGLTMRPRRETFAADYITETLSAAEFGLRFLEAEEAEWVISVLTEYFAATRNSDSPQIREAHRVFISLETAAPTSRARGPQPASTPNHPGDIEVLSRIANGRRSVRWFSDEPVDRRAVDRAVGIALESPTACNRSPYRFEIFDEPSDVRRVADLAMGTRGYSHQIKGLVVVVGLLNAFFDERDRHLIYIDSSLAAMSFVLGLESQGIASCIINWPDIPERELKMRRLLQLSAAEKVVMLIAYGHPLEGSLAPYSGKQSVTEARQFRNLEGAK
ncbi:nitroreductase family protein [Microbacterium sp. QXD-8]|uniref:Nitroreductase family protein n=1 Tax=Microbacterium psychrotolerans TaxID=3068321 RepID=A0ABU0Z3F7_9MICO|nr:nitroreductase family protein [Microbacterium sp. QXD-8]MDQ7878366.1 nitroreductase family protein [Microbacterium sp. QXD-8]